MHFENLCHFFDIFFNNKTTPLEEYVSKGKNIPEKHESVTLARLRFQYLFYFSILFVIQQM